MKEPTVRIEISSLYPTKWYVNLADFANMVKAFVGSNTLSVAYAFRQSGLLLGILGMLLIATLTDHCCQLLAKTKHHAIAKLMDKRRREHEHNNDRPQNNSYDTFNTTPRDSGVDDDDFDDGVLPFVTSADVTETETENNETNYDTSTEAREHMMKHMTYGDIGKMCYGNKGLGAVNFSIALTQFGFCIAYFIFIGNTVHSLFPKNLCYQPQNTTDSKICVPYTTKLNTSYEDVKVGSQNFTNIFLDDNTTTVAPNVSTTVFPNTTIVAEYIREIVSSAPRLVILVASPLPVFIFLTFIKSVRYLGIISMVANFSILSGCIAILGFLIKDFEIHGTVELFNWEGAAIFFGMVTAAFEGIGLVIPIQSSMEGNRHLFPMFLHGALLLITTILGSFGVLGYLKFGDGVQQMLNLNIPAGNPLAMAVNMCICLGILLTFPLQIFPVVEICEKYLFTEGRICGPRKIKYDEREEFLTEEKPLLTSENDVATHIPDSVSGWKRNILRILIVLFAGCLAVLLKDNFAYVSAFVGALGSSVLAFILPCLFHLKICWHDINVFVKAKDILILIFGVLASIVGVVSVTERMVSNLKAAH